MKGACRLWPWLKETNANPATPTRLLFDNSIACHFGYIAPAVKGDSYGDKFQRSDSRSGLKTEEQASYFLAGLCGEPP